MEVAMTLDSWDKFEGYACFESFLLVLLRFSAFHRKGLTDSEWRFVAEELRRRDKKIYLLLDRVMYDEDFPFLEDWIRQAEEVPIDGYFVSDLGLIDFLQKQGLSSKTIYYSQTQVNSFMEAESFLNRGIFRVFLSGELTDFAALSDISFHGSVIRLFGYANLFYSRRKLLNSGIRSDKDENLRIREQNRAMKLRIFQDGYGTYIFSDKPENRLDRIDLLEKRFDMGLIDDQFADEKTKNEMIRLFCEDTENEA